MISKSSHIFICNLGGGSPFANSAAASAGPTARSAQESPTLHSEIGENEEICECPILNNNNIPDIGTANAAATAATK